MGLEAVRRISSLGFTANPLFTGGAPQHDGL
jgi:hypothetical protein